MAISTKDFAECFEKWKRERENCVRSQGAYFERDWAMIVLCTMFLLSCIFFDNVSFFILRGWILFWRTLICHEIKDSPLKI